MKRESSHLEPADLGLIRYMPAVWRKQTLRIARFAVYCLAAALAVSLVAVLTDWDLPPALVLALISIGAIAAVIALVEFSARSNNRYRLLETKVQELSKSGFGVADRLWDESGKALFLFDEVAKVFIILQIGRERLVTSTATFGEVETITFRAEPEQLQLSQPHVGSYTLGGALVGGIPGLLVGSVIDSVRTPKLKRSVDFNLAFDFRLADGSALVCTPIATSFGYDLTMKEFQERAESTRKLMDKHMSAMIRRFGEKVAPQADKLGSPSAEVPTSPMKG